MGVRYDDGPAGSARGQPPLAYRPAVLQVQGVPAGARQPHPDPPGDEGGGRRRDRLGGRAAGRSAQPALLRAAGRDPDRPADRLRLALAGLPAGRRGGVGGDRSLGGQPFAHPERLEHRDHRLRGPPPRLEPASRPARRRAGPRQRPARLRGGQRHPGLRRQTRGGDVDRRRHRRPGRARESCGARPGARGLRCPDTAASLSRHPHRDRFGHRLGMDPRTGRGLAKAGTRTIRGHRQGEAGPRRASAHCPPERTGPAGHRLVLERADEALRVGDRIAIQTRFDHPSPSGRCASCSSDACRRRHARFRSFSN